MPCAGCFAAIFLIGGIVLAILCSVEFRKINTYVTAQCFVSSVRFSSSYGSQSGRYDRVVYNITVYESDGSHTTTTTWSPISDGAALVVINAVQYYQLNHTYACYHSSSPSKPVQVQFDRPSQSRAIGFLCGCIGLFIVGVTMCCWKCCNSICRAKKVQPSSNPPAPVNSTEMTTMPTSSSQQNAFPHPTPEEQQRHVAELPPPSYEEATGQASLARLRQSVGNAFSGLSFARLTSSVTRI